MREDPDNYDLQVLDQGYSMLRPEEHTAMVPHDERERLENLFKGDSDAVNAFVCTPTLELGVDIGQLDAVLMRNVPPLPANYWQRAGRAGRRHRMAVDLTYCRPVSHDRAYFAEPLKLLAGRVDPPAFNLRNDLMVAKHVHATVITRLHQYARDPVAIRGGAPSDRRDAEDVPARPGLGLSLRGRPRARQALRPCAAASADRPERGRSRRLRGARLPAGMAGGGRGGDASGGAARPCRRNGATGSRRSSAGLGRRLRWAMEQIKRLNAVREKQGDLEPEDEALFRRCDALVKRLKGTARRTRREAEGYDDVNTFGVLAAEGFLPGYGLEVGLRARDGRDPLLAHRRHGVRAAAAAERGAAGVRARQSDLCQRQPLRRPALPSRHRRAAGGDARLRDLDRAPGGQADEPGRRSGGAWAPPCCRPSPSAMWTSSISRTSPTRRNCGSRWGLRSTGWSATSTTAGARTAGASRACTTGAASGCGWSMSALRAPSSGSTGSAIPSARSAARASRRSPRTGSASSSSSRTRSAAAGRSTPIGFYADVVADVLSLPACPDQTTAYSVLEALRFAATRVLDMHMEDLQILVIGHVDRDEVDALLWDPMPGGSGLLDQICERFEEIVAVAREVVEDCPSACETSCIDCLQTFRNGYYHKHLDRKVAQERLAAWGSRLVAVARDPGEAALEGA